MRLLLAGAILSASLLAGCSTPVGVAKVGTQETSRLMTASALSTGAPSEWSRQVLHRNSLFERQRTDPEGVLEELYKRLKQQQEATPDALFALAELSYLYAQQYQRRDHYLAAAVFAYAFILPEDERAGVSPVDPRARMALDLYNQSLAEALASAEGDTVDLQTATHSLPFGDLRITADPSQFLWAGFRFKRFTAVSHFMVRGMRNRYRQAGVGAPLVADIEPAGEGAQATRKGTPTRAKVPVTAFVRIDEPLKGVLRGQLEGRLELYTQDQTESLRIGGREVPLEFETTASIAYQLEGAPVWNTEISGFRVAELPALGSGLILLQPHRPGRIPVVFVHGTASSPARWAEMYNELSNDPVLRDRFEFWLFQYGTGQPVLYSASLLRRELRATVDEIDPKHADLALRRMVIVGHSQGGLLTKLMAVSSGTRFWENLTPVPFEEFDAPADARELVRQAMFFEPVPELQRVVFIATPHRGSFRAGGVVEAIVRRLITLPSRLMQNAEAFRNLPSFGESGLNEVPNSVQNMTPNTKFIRTLEELPFAPGIKAHSIIPVNGLGPPDDLDDGVVAYRSAHLDAVQSELVVRSSHSAQSLPETIEEVRRILREHLGVDGTKVR